MTLTSTWNPVRHGDRIGTPYQEQRLIYCRDDNTYTEHPITLRARACRLEWAPHTPEPETIIDLFTELFGDT